MQRDTALIATVVDALPVAVWVGRVPGGELEYANRELEVILGMTAPDDALRGEYSSRYSVHRLDGTPYPESEMPYERAVREQTTLVVDDMVIHRGDGSKVYLRVFVRPLFDAAGAMTHVLEAFTDITREVVAERARTEGEARLRHAQRMESIGALAGGIAHDFNNLLATVKILAAQLRASETSTQRRASLEQIEQVTESGTRLTQSLLGFARRGRTAGQRMALDEIVGQVAELARRTFGARIEVRLDASARCREIVGDSVQIEQLLMNLVVNARDAMPEGGLLVLRTRDVTLETPRDGLAAGRYVLLEVADTGVGIDPSLRERIFEPYFTTRTTGPMRGTGLGLATVYGIVQTHHGSIDVASNTPRGTVMRVLLPAAAG